ncbi:hypothetical protein ABZP36_004564 [Zizania latifolia]
MVAEKLAAAAVAALVAMAMVAARGDVSADRAECADQLVGLAPCLQYVQGQAKAPAPDCCGGLRQVLGKSPKCLCVLVKDKDDPNLGIKINATLALALPSACGATHANVSHCPRTRYHLPLSPSLSLMRRLAVAALRRDDPSLCLLVARDPPSSCRPIFVRVLVTSPPSTRTTHAMGRPISVRCPYILLCLRNLYFSSCAFSPLNSTCFCMNAFKILSCAAELLHIPPNSKDAAIFSPGSDKGSPAAPAKDNSTATTGSRAQQATNGGCSLSSTATAGTALTALLAGYLLLLLPDFLAPSF